MQSAAISLSRLILCLTLLGLCVTALSSPAQAAPAEETSPTATLAITTSDGASLTAGVLSCDVTVDNPHYSTGAAGVIAKVRYTCTGNMSGTLGINANLYRYAPGTVGPYVPRASNNVSRPVGPLAVGTVYVPAGGTSGILCNTSHWYYAAAFLTLSAGPSSNTGTVSSNTVHPSRCS